MAELAALYVIYAPSGVLSGNGQLRETLEERRKRHGDNVPFWYLSPDLTTKFGIPGNNIEAIVSDQLTSINWLKLRFGGQSLKIDLDIEQLNKEARGLPPAPKVRDISD